MQPVAAEVLICNKIGFFEQFLQDDLALVGNCDDQDTAMLVQTPGGLVLRGFGDNGDIPLNLKNDYRAVARGINQFGIPRHTATFNIRNASRLDIHVENNQGGSCDVIAKGGQRCVYEVVTTTCPLDLLVGDRVCMGCTRPTPCKDYGNQRFVVYAGKPVKECTVSLKRLARACRNCNGKPITPKD